MAPTPASITVNWISQYTGQHRVCYRILGSGDPYTCTNSGTHPSCPGVGTPCSYIIPITVDDETCDTITYEGYVQPACEDEGSMAGRIAFPNVSFIPAPACKRWDVTCDDAPVASLNVVGNGTGYTSPPTVSIFGGGGAGATGTAVLGDGIVTAISAWTAGSGYHIANASSTQTVNVLRAGQVATTGAGMTADVTFDAGAVITNIVLNAAGSGYTTFDDAAPLTIDLTSLIDGTAPGAEATIDIDCSGLFADEVASINLTAPGSGYTSPPTVTLSGPVVGVTATATATLEPCAVISMQDCDNVGPETHNALEVGETISICHTTTPTVGGNHSVVESNNCLCDCIEVDIANTGATDPMTIRYVACGGAITETVIAAAGSTGNICIVTNSISYTLTGDAVYDETIIGACDGDGIP